MHTCHHFLGTCKIDGSPNENVGCAFEILVFGFICKAPFPPPPPPPSPPTPPRPAGPCGGFNQANCSQLYNPCLDPVLPYVRKRQPIACVVCVCQPKDTGAVPHPCSRLRPQAVMELMLTRANTMTHHIKGTTRYLFATRRSRWAYEPKTWCRE